MEAVLGRAVVDPGLAPGDEWVAAFAGQGLHPGVLRLRYPLHFLASPWTTPVNCCFDPFAEGASWIETRLDPGRSAIWCRAGFLPCCATGFASVGLEPEEARRWADNGFGDPADIAPWASHGFGPEAVKAWAGDLLSPAIAATWRDAGMTPADVREWAWLWAGPRALTRRASSRQPRPHDLDDVVLWKASRLPVGYAKLWTRAGLTADDLRRVAPEQRPDPVTMRALAALRRASPGAGL